MTFLNTRSSRVAVVLNLGGGQESNGLRESFMKICCKPQSSSSSIWVLWQRIWKSTIAVHLRIKTALICDERRFTSLHIRAQASGLERLQMGRGWWWFLILCYCGTDVVYDIYWMEYEAINNEPAFTTCSENHSLSAFRWKLIISPFFTLETVSLPRSSVSVSSNILLNLPYYEVGM